MIHDEVELVLKELLALEDKPEAIFIGSDRLTISSMSILKKWGLKVPGDIAIAGFTNSDVVDLFDPPLTVVRQPAFQIGQMATEMLIKTIESKWPVEEFTTEKVDTQLIVRSSSAKGKK
jgi:LacI family transcriptional regulator